MTTHDHTHHKQRDAEPPHFWTSRAFMVFLAFALIAGVLLWTEHRAHLLGALPFVLLLACPLLHVFGGHGSHGSHGGRTDTGSKGDRS